MTEYRITKKESQIIRSEFPDVWIPQTGRGKPAKRHRRYLPEVTEYLRLIADTNIEAAKILKAKNRASKQRRKG